MTLEANWLETIAADQTTMRDVLAKLPAAYALLHDLNVPGSKGTIDHVVVGPGGAFIVISRRYGEHIDYRDGQLWAGDRSLSSVLEGARVESELMTRVLATPVVPVLALLDTLLPAATPGVVDGVLVTSEENAVRVITRGAHTLLGPDKVHDITQRAMPMLHTAESAPRADAADSVHADPPGLRGTPTLPSEPSPSLRAPSGRAVPLAAPDYAPTGPADPKVTSAHRRSVWGMGVVIAGMCLIAVALGSLVRLVWTDDDAPSPTVASTAAATVGSSTVESSTTPPSTTPPVTNALPAPVVAYTAVCPGPGAGWDMVPTWPGDIEGLLEYDVEMLITDSWVSLTGWKNATEETSATLHGQPANASYTIRMTAVLADGSRSVNTPTPVTSPADSC